MIGSLGFRACTRFDSLYLFRALPENSSLDLFLLHAPHLILVGLSDVVDDIEQWSMASYLTLNGSMAEICGRRDCWWMVLQACG